MIAGQTKNIGLPPVGFKDLDPKENFIPFQIDLRNGKVTKAGNWERREGYSEESDMGEDSPIDAMFSQDLGIAITENGLIFKDVVDNPTEMTGATLNGFARPQGAMFDNKLYIVDGGQVVKVDDGETFEVSGKTGAKYIGRVGGYTLYAGYDSTEFTWSAVNNPEEIVSGDSGRGNVKKTGGIMFATDYRNKWLVWKGNEVEVWHNRGGSTPFVRLNELTIPKGLLASYSVVKANQTIYWLSDDFKFVTANGASAQSISEPYDGYIKERILTPEDCYGIEFTKEGVIRWFFPTDGVCFRYDYTNNSLTEDNIWMHGQYERMPINSYMELNGKQYFGDYEPTGKIFEWSEDFKDDDGTETRMLREFKVKLTESGNFAKVNRMRFMLERGVSTLTETNPKMLFRWRFDEDPEDVEWITETIGLGIGTDAEPYVDLFGLGLGRTMHMQIIENDDVDFMLLGMLITTQENRI